MADNNTPNINNIRPVGVNSANNTSRGLQNMGQRPNYPPRATNTVSRSTPNSTQANRQSASERFERGSQNLAHMNIGATGTKLYRVNRSPQEESMRKKIGGFILDDDLVKNANNRRLNNKSNQKTVAIVILSVMLALSLIYLAFAIAVFYKKDKKPNCKYYISSDVSAYWMVDNSDETEFVIKDGLTSGKIYLIKSSLIIDSVDKVNIKITISAILDGVEISIAGLDGAPANLIRGNGNVWTYEGGHQGAGEVHMFNGIDFFGAPENLNSNNVTITVRAEIKKV